MGVKEFGAALKTYWKTFAAISIGIMALGAIWLVFTPLQYVSTTQLLVSINGTSTATAYQNDSVVTGRVDSYIVLLTSDAVSRKVVDELALPMSPGEFAAKVSATNVPPKTAIIDVAVVDDSPGRARQLAQTLAEQFIGYADALETPTGDDGQKVRTTVVSPASEPRSRIDERVALGGLLVLAALLAGAVAVWIRAATDPVLRIAARAATAAGVPVVGRITSGETSGGQGDYLDAPGAPGRGGGMNLVVVSATGEVDATDVARKLADVLADDDVIIGAPPVLASFTTWPFGGSGHTVLLFVALGISRRRDVELAAARLTTAGAPLTGVVLVWEPPGRKPPEEQPLSHDDHASVETSAEM